MRKTAGAVHPVFTGWTAPARDCDHPIAIEDGVAVQDIDYPELSAKLLELGQILTYPANQPAAETQSIEL